MDVARSTDPRESGAYNAVIEARAAAGSTGHVPSAIGASGRVDHSMTMSYAAFVRFLRRKLAQLGLDPSHAKGFAGQSLRAYAAMEAARARGRPENTALLAGVKYMLLTYNRADIGDLLRAFWALGL